MKVDCAETIAVRYWRRRVKWWRAAAVVVAGLLVLSIMLKW